MRTIALALALALALAPTASATETLEHYGEWTTVINTDDVEGTVTGITGTNEATTDRVTLYVLCEAGKPGTWIINTNEILTQDEKISVKGRTANAKTATNFGMWWVGGTYSNTAYGGGGFPGKGTVFLAAALAGGSGAIHVKVGFHSYSFPLAGFQPALLACTDGTKR